MKLADSLVKDISLISSNIKFYLSSTSIIFFYSFFLFSIYIVISESQIFGATSNLTGIFVRGDYNYSPVVTLLFHFLIFILSILSIHRVNIDRLEVSKSFTTILIILLITRKLLLISSSGDNGLSQGFIVGLQFYSVSIVALTPIVILSFKNNLNSKTHSIFSIILVLILVLCLELIINIKFNLLDFKNDSLPILINFGSYSLAFIVYYHFLKNNKACHSYKNNHLARIVRKICIVTGLPILLLFFMFA